MRYDNSKSYHENMEIERKAKQREKWLNGTETYWERVDRIREQNSNLPHSDAWYDR